MWGRATMAVSTSAAPARRGQQPPGQSRGGIRSPVTWLVVLGIALAGGAYLLYKRSTSSSASGTSTSTTDTPSGTQNPDWSGEIATLQTEIGDLQSTIDQDQDNSGSSEDVTVPPVTGEDLEAAQQTLGDAGLKSTATGPKTTKAGEVREVSAQTPGAGAKVSRGTTVKLTYKIANPPAAKKKPATAAGKAATNAVHTTSSTKAAASSAASSSAASKPAASSKPASSSKPAAKPAAKKPATKAKT